jgi:AbrB family looped-hinge helix DNA binding protein
MCILTYEWPIDMLLWESDVQTVKISPKYQVVIPKRVREQLGLKPGEELQVYVLDGSIRFSKPCSISELRGAAKGLRWTDEDRDHTDRF